MTPLQKLPKNLGELGKLIVAKGLEKLPKVQKIAQSGHTVWPKHILSIYSLSGNLHLHNLLGIIMIRDCLPKKLPIFKRFECKKICGEKS